ncbi:MAG: hypothetical protein JNM27_19350 [Leptospirales bacterium]|nr:hypothetical protein [Leptospirales bacterium]
MLASILVVLASLVLVTSRQNLPHAVAGPAAESVVSQIESRVGKAGWEKLEAVSFYFVPGGRAHFKDFRRNFVEVQFAMDSSQFLVQYDSDGRFVIYKNRQRIQGQVAEQVLVQAQKFHTADFFLLNPFVQLRGAGVEHKITEEGDLLVLFPSGPMDGDSYVIRTDATGMPLQWKVWSGSSRLKGLKFQFENWRELSPGVRTSLMHTSFFKNVEIRDVRGFTAYPGPENKDRFTELAEMKK